MDIFLGVKQQMEIISAGFPASKPDYFTAGAGGLDSAYGLARAHPDHSGGNVI